MEKGALLKSSSNESLRPANIYIPCLKVGQQAALDFAVTSGLRNDRVMQAAGNNRYATEEYAQHKRMTLNMDRLCMSNDIKFIPMIVEGSGGAWGLDAEDVFKVIIKSTASLGGETVSIIANQLYQALSVILHKANARAIFKRLPGQKHIDVVAEAASNLMAEEKD